MGFFVKYSADLSPTLSTTGHGSYRQSGLSNDSLELVVRVGIPTPSPIIPISEF